jgi:hypothetical protein
MAYDFIGITNKALKELNEVEFADSTEFGNATGFHSLMKDYINWSISEIYNREDNQWSFQKQVGTQVLLTDGTVDYSVNANAAEVDWDSFYIAEDIALDDPDFKKLTLMPLPTYRDIYRIQDLNMDSDGYGKPSYVVQNIDNTFSVSLPAAEAYTVKYDYLTKFVPLSAYNDTTLVPVRYEQVIIDGALMRANAFRDNIEQSALYEKRYEDGIIRMRRNLIPISDTMLFRE